MWVSGQLIEVFGTIHEKQQYGIYTQTYLHTRDVRFQNPKDKSTFSLGRALKLVGVNKKVRITIKTIKAKKEVKK